MDPFERTLLEGCRRGERQAQKELYEQYKGLLFGVCLRYAAGKEEAEDMLQEGFIQIFRDLYRFQPNRPLAAWMYRVTANACLQYLRRHKRLKLFENYPEETVQQEEGAVEREREEVENLLSFVQRLPDGQRAVFNLFAIEGYTHAEIAGILGISESGSKSQLSRARAALRRMMLQKEKINQEPCP
ncbi:MAG: sigma-70 family RNA polymerase sigma factor [Phaeodactylibacter sp.]|nr:sigma-70 family RNA polymerase sigma factor [Phaeodactylibacter sp.]